MLEQQSEMEEKGRAKEREANMLREKEFQKQMTELEDLKRWKEGVTKALWIIFGSLVAIVARILMMHNGA